MKNLVSLAVAQNVPRELVRVMRMADSLELVEGGVVCRFDHHDECDVFVALKA